MGEHFSASLGYNVYLFGLVYESRAKQYNFIYGEECISKGSHNVASMVYYFLRHIAGDHIRAANIS